MANSISGSLFTTQILKKTILASAIQALSLPGGSRGLDIGCGVGLQSVMLAEEIGGRGRVTGLDLSADILADGRDVVEKSSLSERIRFVPGSMDALPFKNDSFDWVWSSDCVGYSPQDPLPLVKEMVRVVRPGGIVTVLAWSSEQLLPGYPLLEARLKATVSGMAPFAGHMPPENHFQRGLGWLRDSGIPAPSARVFADCVHAPLSEPLITALSALLEMRWPGVQSDLSEQDFAEFDRLCRPGSPDFILEHADYFASFTYSMFWGRKPSPL